MTTKYQKFGLRADKNLDDLINPYSALGNLLDGLAVEQSLGFVPADLQVINGLRNTTVSNEDFLQLDGILQEYTDSATDAILPLQPLVTIKDQIDNFKVIMGDPPQTLGGDGPNSYLVPSSDMIDIDNLSKTSTGSDVRVSNSNTIGPIDFWDSGVFIFGVKLYQKFPDTFGAAQWIGYTDIDRATVTSTGLFIIEQDPLGDDNWEIFKSIYAETRTVDVESSVNDGSQTTIQLAEGEARFVCLNDRFNDDENHIVTGVDNTTDVVIIQGTPTIGSTASFTFTMSTDEIDSGRFYMRETYRNDKFRLRITVMWPDTEDGRRLPNKNFTFNDRGNTTFQYSYFYKTYDRAYNDSPKPGSYLYFDKNRANPLAENFNAPLQVTDTLSIDYVPPQDVTDKFISTSPRTFTHRGLGKIESTGQFDNVEYGDWLHIVDTNQVLQVTQRVDDDIAYVKYDLISDIAVDAEFTATPVKNLGLIGLYTLQQTSDTTGTLVSISGGPVISEVRADYLIASAGLTKFKRVNSVSGSTVTVSNVYSGDASTLETGSNLVAIYSSKGLEDLSSVAQCIGVFGKEVTVAGSTATIGVSDTTNITLSPKTYVQFTGASSSVNADVYVSGISGTTLTLSRDGGGAIFSGTVEVASTLVFVEEAYYDGTNKEFCIIPLNTAPPFAGTQAGLTTTANEPNLRANTIAFNEINIKGATSAETTDSTFSETLDITYNGVTYKALIN